MKTFVQVFPFWQTPVHWWTWLNFKSPKKTFFKIDLSFFFLIWKGVIHLYCFKSKINARKLWGLVWPEKCWGGAVSKLFLANCRIFLVADSMSEMDSLFSQSLGMGSAIILDSPMRFYWSTRPHKLNVLTYFEFCGITPFQGDSCKLNVSQPNPQSILNLNVNPFFVTQQVQILPGLSMLYLYGRNCWEGFYAQTGEQNV